MKEKKRFHDEYIMHPPMPATRTSILQSMGVKLQGGEHLPIDNIPALLKSGCYCMAHFYWNPKTKNCFSVVGLENRVEQSNLVLSIRPTINEKTNRSDGANQLKAEL